MDFDRTHTYPHISWCSATQPSTISFSNFPMLQLWHWISIWYINPNKNTIVIHVVWSLLNLWPERYIPKIGNWSFSLKLSTHPNSMICPPLWVVYARRKSKGRFRDSKYVKIKTQMSNFYHIWFWSFLQLLFIFNSFPFQITALPTS